MHTHGDVLHSRMNRRVLLKTLGVAGVGSAATLSVASRANAAATPFPRNSAPRPIPFVAGPTGAPDPFNFIHWTLPGPPGSTTQINELEAFGLDVDPSVITDFSGFTAYAVLAGTAKSAEGEDLECELDVRVMDGSYVGEDGRQHRGTFGFFWLDLFTPGAGAAGQVHDFNPGILQNGVFWTMSVPRDSFHVRKGGRMAQFRVRDLPMPDTFQFANSVSVAGQIDVDVTWRATSAPVPRGNGTSVPANDPSAFLGELAEASCKGRAGGAETGFSFKTGDLTAEGFFAELGEERNGVFL